MNDELKNKIRRERIIEIIYNQKNKLVTNRNTFYNSAIPKIDAYYKSPTQFSLKDVTEDDIEDLKNKKLKKDCIDFLNTLGVFNVDYIHILTDAFKEMSIDDVLLKTYRRFLDYQITIIGEPVDYDAFNNMTLDSVEEMRDNLIIIRNEKYKCWWNIF